jgi:pSer/pThr/pTyr-binding forkhead associated (FHA) protein
MPPSGEELALGPVTSIGRDLGNDIVLNDTFVSRQHAKIHFEDEAFYLYDLASKNGTYVNEEEVSSCRLVHGDKVQLGRTVMTFNRR